MSSKQPPDAVRGHLTWLLNQAGARGKDLVTEQLGGRGVRPLQYVMLLTLRESGPMSQADLGRRTGLDRSDVTGGLRGLVGRGLVEQDTDDDDRRRKVVSLTARGRRETVTLLRLVERAQQHFVEPLSTDQERLLRELLTILLDHHAEWQPTGERPSTGAPPARQ